MSEYSMGASAAVRVADFFDVRIGRCLRRADHRASFATYAFGILGDGDRKSIEPIAARACADDEVCPKVHDRLLHFVREGAWDDRAVRREATRYIVEKLSAREAVTTWIIDDTGMLKQGRHSPGVQRQYTGSAGKIANCQLAVSLSIATRTEQVPIDMELYMPEVWINDRARRRRARVPDALTFKTKVELAIELIDRAAGAGVPGNVVLADAFYGRSHVFRDSIRQKGLDYAVAVDADTRVWTLDEDGRNPNAVQVRDLGVQLGEGAYRTISWRDGTRRGRKLRSRFAFVRAKPAHDDGPPVMLREPVWLVAEWPAGEEKPTKFFLTSLRRRMTRKQVVAIIMERWKTERVYEELKGELGFDHYEGRSFVGWHHHVSVVICCYAFVVAERVGAFPPSAGRTGRPRTLAVAA